MATYSSEYIFEISKQKYEKIQEIITEVCEIVKTVQPDPLYPRRYLCATLGLG